MLQLLLQIYFDVIKRSVLDVLTIFRTVNFSSVLLVVASRACDVLLTAPRRGVSTLCPWLRHQVSQALIYWVAVERLQFCSFCFYYSFDIWFLIPLLVTENCNSFVSRCRSRTLQYAGNWALDIRWRSAKPKTSQVCVWGKGEEASLEVARGQVSGVERPLLTSGSGASRPNWPLYRLGSQFPELVSFCRVYSKVASLTVLHHHVHTSTQAYIRAVARCYIVHRCTLGVSQSRPGEECAYRMIRTICMQTLDRVSTLLANHIISRKVHLI